MVLKLTFLLRDPLFWFNSVGSLGIVLDELESSVESVLDELESSIETVLDELESSMKVGERDGLIFPCEVNTTFDCEVMIMVQRFIKGLSKNNEFRWIVQRSSQRYRIPVFGNARFQMCLVALCNNCLRCKTVILSLVLKIYANTQDKLLSKIVLPSFD